MHSAGRIGDEVGQMLGGHGNRRGGLEGVAGARGPFSRTSAWKWTALGRWNSAT